jgi:hypothetical protein
MKKEHPADELTRDQFMTFVFEIYGIFNDNDKDGLEVSFNHAKKHFFQFAENTISYLQNQSIARQNSFIDKLKKDCYADQPDAEAIRRAGINNNFTGNTLQRLHFWIFKYREFVRNLVPDAGSFGNADAFLRDFKATAPFWFFQSSFARISDSHPSSTERTEDKQVETDQVGISPKLHWKGPTNVLIDMFAQCLAPPTGKPYLEETAHDLARFILAHFEGIGSNHNTIATEISKYKNANKKAPRRRINLNQNDT